MRLMSFTLLFICSCLLLGCNEIKSNGPGPTPTPTINPDIQITEVESEPTNIFDETIRLNNCGGKADVTQTAERALTATVDGASLLGLDAGVLKSAIMARYQQSQETRKTIILTAPAGTNMEFQVAWTEEVSVGNVTIPGLEGEATYRTNLPVSAELVSSMDWGCGENEEEIGEAEPPTELPEPTEVPTEQPTNTPRPTEATQSTGMLQSGETWYGEKFSLTVENFSYDQVEVYLYFRNETGREIVFPGMKRAKVVFSTDAGDECVGETDDVGQTILSPEDYLYWTIFHFGHYCPSYSPKATKMYLHVKDLGGYITDAWWEADIPRP